MWWLIAAVTAFLALLGVVWLCIASVRAPEVDADASPWDERDGL